MKDNKTITLHELREIITALPIKNTNYRWRIATRNKNIGWNECRLEMLKKLGEISNECPLCHSKEHEWKQCPMATVYRTSEEPQPPATASKGVDVGKLANFLFSRSVYWEMYGTWENCPEGHQRVFIEQATAIKDAIDRGEV